jgi:hypothetical protein
VPFFVGTHSGTPTVLVFPTVDLQETSDGFARVFFDQLLARRLLKAGPWVEHPVPPVARRLGDLQQVRIAAIEGVADELGQRVPVSKDPLRGAVTCLQLTGDSVHETSFFPTVQQSHES